MMFESEENLLVRTKDIKDLKDLKDSKDSSLNFSTFSRQPQRAIPIIEFHLQE